MKVCDLARFPLEESAFYGVDPSLEPTPGWDKEVCAKQVKQVLRRMGLTMTRVSSLTKMRYGEDTAYFIPRSFLHRQRHGITPHICQMVALSQVTGFRFVDWMKLCGFDFELIRALQLRVHTERTAIIVQSQASISPDSRILLRNSGFQNKDDRYLFAKIGSRDAVAYPNVLPGSVVRADRCHIADVFEKGSADDRLWLVEHPGGITCCFVKPVDTSHVLLLPNHPPLSGWPLRLSREVRILGLVDLELRPREPGLFRPMRRLTRSEIPFQMDSRDSSVNFSTLLRISRARSGLTLRAAHEMTIRVARLLGNREHAIALGLLSDYEAMNTVPRHVAKIMSLCIIYGIDLFELMRAGGVYIDDSDKAPLVPIDARPELRQIA